MKILFVCLGNICRSPMAEAIFQHKIEKRGWRENIETDSAGTAGYHIGERPDRRTIQVLAANDIHTDHRSRQVAESDASIYDFIIAMDATNLEDLQQKLPNKTILLMRDYDSEDPGSAVPDPYYGDLSDFEAVYTILNRSIDTFIHQEIQPIVKHVNG